MDTKVQPTPVLGDLESLDSGGPFLYRNGKSLGIIFGRMETYDMGSDINRSTCGFIRSQEIAGIRQVAMSGWSGKNPASPWVLDPVKYTQIVRDVAKNLEFHLPADRWDNGNKGVATAEQKGRFVACHIEKKLSVWFIRKVLKALLSTRDIAQMASLRSIQIPDRMKRAKIFLDHDPCYNCLSFLERLTAETGISFVTERCQSFVKGERVKANFVFGDDPPVPQSAAKAASRAKPSNLTEAQGLIHTSPPKPVGSQRFDILELSENLDSLRMFPHLYLLRSPQEGSSWRRYPNCAKPTATKLNEEETRRLNGLPTAGKMISGRQDPTTSPTPLRHRVQTQPKRSPTTRLEVLLKQMDASRKREFRRVLDDALSQTSSRASLSGDSHISSKSGGRRTSSIDGAKRRLNLRKFQYGSQTFSAPQSRVEKSKTRSSHGARQNNLRKQSIFALAFKNHHAQMDLHDRGN